MNPSFLKSLPRSASKALAALLLFLVSFLVYLNTVAPGVYGFDSAELATGVYVQGVVHPPGYPLYLLIGKLFTFLPAGDIAYRLNVMSAFFAALTVVLLFRAIENIVGNRFAAWTASCLFAVSNYFWQMALITEVYTMFTAFLAADLLVITLWRKTGLGNYLLLFALLYGLTLTVHVSGILFAPAFAWLILNAPSWRKWHWLVVPVMSVLFLFAVALPYAYLSLRASAHPSIDYSHIYAGVDLSTLSGLWWFVSGKAYTIFAFGYNWNEVPGEIWRFAGYLWRNYMGVGVILGAVGIAGMWRKSPTWTIGLLLMFAANAFFYINYRVLDKDTMFLPAYEVWAVFVAAGMTMTARRLERISGLDTGGEWLSSARIILPLTILVLSVGLNWRWVDMSNANGYMLFARGMMTETAPGSVIIAPWSSAVVLEYYQLVQGQRTDLQIINRSRYGVARYYELWKQGLPRDEILARIHSEEVNFIDQNIHQKTIYAVEYDPVLAQQFEYLPDGRVFRLAAP